MDARWKDSLHSLGLLILRLGVAGFMLPHGWSKVQMLLAGEYDKLGDPIGLGSGLSLFLVVVAEFVGPLVVVVGLGTRIAAVPTVVAMAVAAFVAHGGDPWTMEEGAKRFMAGQARFWGSKEPALLYLFPFLALIFTGAGRFSVDGLLWPRARTETPEPLSTELARV